jgi:hypothetical protein
VKQYLTRVLETVAPGYLQRGTTLLNDAIALAKRNAEYMMRSQQAAAYPPKAWLMTRMDEDQFEQQFSKYLDELRTCRVVRDGAKCIDQAHLLDCVARHVKEAQARENNGESLSARNSDVEAIYAE